MSKCREKKKKKPARSARLPSHLIPLAHEGQEGNRRRQAFASVPYIFMQTVCILYNGEFLGDSDRQPGLEVPGWGHSGNTPQHSVSGGTKHLGGLGDFILPISDQEKKINTEHAWQLRYA